MATWEHCPEVLLHYRVLGKTGLLTSLIGFGASALGNVFGTVSREDSNAVVGSAIDRGINFFDVSPYYGITLAEERLGKGLGTRREEIILATKCGRYGAELFDFSAETVTREFESSLRRLRTDHVDLLQVHDVEFGSVNQIVNETIPALRRLQESGKARFIGITGYWPGLLAAIAEQVEVDTILNYCHSNLLMWDMDDELAPFTQRKHIGLINASSLHMGLLGGPHVAEWHPAPVEVRVAAEKIRACCSSFGLHPATVAQSWCVTNPAVSSTLIGIGNLKELDESLEALRLIVPPDLLREIRQIAEPVSRMTWPSGLAENQPIESLHAR